MSATLHLLCAGAAQGLVKALQPRLRAEAGAEIAARFGAVGAMKEALLAGEPCDLMIVTEKMVGQLVEAGWLRADMRVPLGRVRTGIAVRRGEPHPDTSTPDALKAALLAADHEQALRVGRELERLDFHWYEEPINAYDLGGYAELCRALEIPVVAAEMVPGSIRSTAQYIAQGAGDILRADVYWRGGITALMKTAHLCEAFGIKTEPHHGGSPLMDVATLHCACAMKNCEFLEVLVPESRYQFGLKHYLEVDGRGEVHVPAAPGLGVEIDWDFIDVHTTYAG